MWDFANGPVLYTDGTALNHPYRGHSDNQDTIQDEASDNLHHFCTVSDHFFICYCQLAEGYILVPLSRTYKIGDSCQTYINYYKTQTMATCYRGVGHAGSQDINADIQDEYQANINDLENIKPDHETGLKGLTCEIEQLQQTVEANDNDPMDDISHFQCKCNQLALTLCPPMPVEPIGEVLNKYTNTLCNAQKKMSFVNSLLWDITILNRNDSSQLEDWLTDIKITSDLTGKSRTKLAQAKSKGLMSTLIS